MQTYDDYQNTVSSEKTTLAIVEAARRLIGFTLYSGSIYQLPLNTTKIVEISDSGTALTEVFSIDSITTGTYYYDKSDSVIYVRVSDSTNPNGKILVLIERYYFSNSSGIIAAHDLSTGYEVEWTPLIKGTSEFGVSLDNVNQLGVAIEGTGRIDFHNDLAFWKTRYDKIIWDNKKVLIYSWNRKLPITEAKIIYRGRIQGKSWSEMKITFKLKDFLNELRAPVELENIGDVGGAIIPDSLQNAKKRLIFGEVNGFRPTNIDQVVDGYTLTGTISITAASTTLTGSGTSFLNDLSPEDVVLVTPVGGDEVELTILSITSDTVAVLTEAAEISTSGRPISVRPNLPKRYTNRDWILSDRTLREPITTIVDSGNTKTFTVADTTDFNADDIIIVASEIKTILRILPGNKIRISTTLLTPPAIGSDVQRLTVFNTFINTQSLTHGRDYTYDASVGTFTLDEEAEFNVSTTRTLTGTASFTTSSRTVTGSSTIFSVQLNNNSWIRASSESTWFEVSRIISDTELELKEDSTYTKDEGAFFKNPDVFNNSDDILHTSILGVTEDGTTSGDLVKTGPAVVEYLLEEAGLTSSINAATFNTAKNIAHQQIGIVVPENYEDTETEAIRDIINKMNISVFGSLIQNEDFELVYNVIDPSRDDSKLNLAKEDILRFSIDSTSDKIVKTVLINYNQQEYNQSVGGATNDQSSASSDQAEYLVQTNNEKLVETYLVGETDADIYAARWVFFLEFSQSVLKFKSKLRPARLAVSDKIDIDHPKLYERFGLDKTRKIGAIQSAKKSGSDTSIELDDLANALTRCGTWTEADAADYTTASDNEKMINGYWTDEYGMQDNDSETFGINLWW